MVPASPTVKTIGEIAEHIHAVVHGNADKVVSRVNTLQAASATDLSFFANSRYLHALRQTQAAVVILNVAALADCPGDALVVDDAYLGYARAAALLYPELSALSPGIHQQAVLEADVDIDPSAHLAANVLVGSRSRIGSGVVIGANSVIAEDVVIGSDTWVAPNVTIYPHSVIGDNVRLHAGVVIGSDGFGIARSEDGWVKVPQLGGVDIGDDVEIGANTTVDRGSIADTVIARGVKIDNQVQIAHNVKIGEYTAIAGCSGIAGSATIGRRCIIGGDVCINGHVTVADDVVLLGASNVSKSIAQAGTYSGAITAMDNRAWLRFAATINRLVKQSTNKAQK